MHAMLNLSQALILIKETEVCLAKLKYILGKVEVAGSDERDAQDDLALMRFADDGNPNCD
jgi:hypothetical protein